MMTKQRRIVLACVVLLMMGVGIGAGLLMPESAFAARLHRQIFHQNKWYAAPGLQVAFQHRSPWSEYTVTTQQNYYDAAGRLLEHVANRTVAQRADGARVEVFENIGPKGTARRRDISFPDTSGVSLLDEGVKTTFAPRFDQVFYWATRLDPDADCSSRRESYKSTRRLNELSTILGREDRSGFLVVKLLDGRTGGTQWRSPELDCALLYMQVPYSSAESNVRLITWDLVSVEKGPPDPGLFAINGDEIKPSEFAIHFAKNNLAAFDKNTPADIRRREGEIRADPLSKRSDDRWAEEQRYRQRQR